MAASSSFESATPTHSDTLLKPLLQSSPGMRFGWLEAFSLLGQSIAGNERTSMMVTEEGNLESPTVASTICSLLA